MDLYLVPNDPENTTLMSASGTAHFRVSTVNASGSSVTYLQRPSETLEAGLLAEVRSERGKRITTMKSTLLGAMMLNRASDDQGVDASKFLYRKGRFDTSSRYFIGNDGAEYRWKYQKSLGWTLTECSTGHEISQQVRWFSDEGIFAGQERSALRIHPCSIDLELVVLSFIVAEKQRRARHKPKLGEMKTRYAEGDPMDGGASEGAEGEAEAGIGEM